MTKLHLYNPSHTTHNTLDVSVQKEESSSQNHMHRTTQGTEISLFAAGYCGGVQKKLAHDKTNDSSEYSHKLAEHHLHKTLTFSSGVAAVSSTPNKASIHTPWNPFDVAVDSLHLPSFSPSVFATSTQDPIKENSFRWSIDQIAELKPADIDEDSQQETRSGLDPELEEKAQKAIDTFFSQNHVVPSPWGTSAKHVTFSPYLASTAYYMQYDESLSPQSLCQSKVPKKEACTQTILSIPPNTDLLKILGQFFTFHENQYIQESVENCYSDVDMLSTSSLRRKLFDSEESSNSKQEDVVISTIPSSPVSPKHCCTPDKKTDSWTNSDHSSPVTPYNCSLLPNHTGPAMTSPSVSPIAKSVQKTPKSGYCLSVTSSGVSGIASRSLKTILQRNAPSLEVSMTSVAEIPVCSEESVKNITHDMQSDYEGGEIFASSPSKDTGYQTGSATSLSLHEVLPNTRITPVVQMLDSCMISYSQIPSNELTSQDMSIC